MKLDWRKWADQSLMLARTAPTEFEREQRMKDYRAGMARAEKETNADRSEGK